MRIEGEFAQAIELNYSLIFTAVEGSFASSD